MTNELVKVNNQQIAGMEEIAGDDLVLPRYQASFKTGMILNSLTNDEARTKNFVFLSLRKGRVMFFPQGSSEKMPECRSNDRLTGTAYGKCEDCQHRCFGEDAQGNKAKPRCHALYDFLVMSEGQKVPYGLSISTPTSQGIIKKFLTYFIEAGKPMFSQVTQFSFEQMKSKVGNSYYVVKFTKVKDLDEDEQQKYYDLMIKYRIKPVVEEEVVTESEDLPETDPSLL